MADTLEDGDIYFFYRPRVGEEQVESINEVQRLLIVLHPVEPLFAGEWR